MNERLLHSGDFAGLLHGWRVRALNILSWVGIGVGALALSMPVVDTLRHPQRWPYTAVLTGIYLLLAALAFVRRLDFRVRGWALLLLGYIAGSVSLARMGLAGAGRIYLTVLPMLAMILIGRRSGLAAATLSLGIMTLFAWLAGRGVLNEWLISRATPTDGRYWREAAAGFAVLVVVMAVLLEHFNRLYAGKIDTLQRVVADQAKQHAEELSQAHIRRQHAEDTARESQRRLEESYRRERERGELADTLRQVTKTLTGTLELQEVLDLMLVQLEKVLPYDRATVMLLREEAGELHTVATRDRSGGEFGEANVPVEQYELNLAVLQGRQAILIPRVTEDARWQPTGAMCEVRSFISAPLLVHARPIGLLGIGRRDDIPYTEDDAQTVFAFATQAAIALENARLYAETQERARRLTLLHEVSLVVNSSLDLKIAMSAACQKLVEDFALGDHTGLAIFDENYTYGEVIAEFPDQGAVGVRLSLENNLASQQVIQTRRPLAIYDARHDPLMEPVWDAMRKVGIHSILILPLVAGDRVIGTVGIDAMTAPHRFTPAEIELAQTVTAQLSTAIANARLFELAQRRAQEAETLRYASAAVAAALRLDEAIEYILQELGRVVPHDSASVQLLREGYLEIVGGRGWPDPQAIVGMRIPTPGDNPNTLVIQTRRPLILADAPSEFAIFHEEAHSRIRSWLGVPLIVHDDVIGILSVDSVTPGYFTRDHARLAAAFADHVAIAIENARLFEQTERRAAEMETLTDIGQALSSKLNVRDVLQLIYEQTRRVIYADNMIIMLYDPQRDEIVCGFSQNPEEIQPGARLPRGTGLTGHIITHRQSVLLRDNVVESIHQLGLEVVGQPSASWLGVPMLMGDRVLGVIIVQHYTTPNVYDESHRRLLETIAAQAAIAIENARLFEEIQREKRYSESLILNSPTAIVVGDKEHRILSWNPAAERLFGYTQAEAVGHSIDELIVTDTLRAEAEEYTRQIGEGQIVRAITRRARQDGTPVDVELLAVPLAVAGEQVGVLAIYHDITELQRAREAAEAANRAKSTFLATMSHEIRTPMNAVIGMTSLLLDTPLTPEQREFVETIRDSGNTLLTLLNDILDFSKIEAGRLELERQPFDVRECVESALDLLAPYAAQKGLEIAAVMDSRVPPIIVGDVTRLRQILINLLNNAVKFTEQGEVVVECGMEEGTGSKNLRILHFAVRDTGIGIPADRLEYIFQAFTQVDTSTTRKYGGTGLGLTISKRLAELMGGTMWAESPPPTGGKGSIFHFTIQAEVAPIARPVYLEESQPNLHGRRVLIVDGSRANRQAVSQQVKSWGMQPVETDSPAQAMAWLQRGDRFDVVLLDVQASGEAGEPSLDQIRQQWHARTLPIVRLGPGMTHDAGKPEEPSPPYLTKPVKASQLYNVLVGIFAQPDETTPKGEAMPRSPFDAEMGQRWPLRILLAEDNVVNQKLALRILERLGYRADVAGNGLEVLQALQRQQYDVVLMDVQMPEMDGLDATRTIRRELDAGRQPRIIAMTANAMKEDRDICLAAGMDDYLSKPIRVEELTSALRRCFPFGPDRA